MLVRAAIGSSVPWSPLLISLLDWRCLLSLTPDYDFRLASAFYSSSGIIVGERYSLVSEPARGLPPRCLSFASLSTFWLDMFFMFF
jgi:hypothetical protein